MEKMNYQQAYDKIIQAYLNDEIKPLHPASCFCGTLSPDMNWNRTLYKENYPYSYYEYQRMESALFCGMHEIVPYTSIGEMAYHPSFEEAIFNGMCKAIGVLQQIHFSRGEVIDEVPVFTKREKMVAV